MVRHDLDFSEDLIDTTLELIEPAVKGTVGMLESAAGFA